MTAREDWIAASRAASDAHHVWRQASLGAQWRPMQDAYLAATEAENEAFDRYREWLAAQPTVREVVAAPDTSIALADILFAIGQTWATKCAHVMPVGGLDVVLEAVRQAWVKAESAR